MAQLFKTIVPIEKLETLLKDICIKHTSCFIFNNDSFKKGIFTGQIPEFIEACKPNYHISKLKYLDKKLTYKTFVTILRQICNTNMIKYTSKIVYDKSKYIINYFIYI